MASAGRNCGGFDMRFLRVNVAFVLLLILLPVGDSGYAQSGHAVMNGYVAFEGVAFVDKQPRARVELRPAKSEAGGSHVTATDEHGHYKIDPAPLGECILRISSPGFTTYEISVYIPSDFIGNLAIMMKKSGAKEGSKPKNR
jgi:hypothetical protein